MTFKTTYNFLILISISDCIFCVIEGSKSTRLKQRISSFWDHL